MSMDSLNVLQERCENLRWKGLYIDGGEGVSTAGTAPIYWCLKTHIGIGPDGQLVGAEECCGGRGCYSAL